MLTPGTLQCSDTRVMIRTKLAETYRQRSLVCAVTFHFLLVTFYYGFGHRYVPTFYQLPATARSARPSLATACIARRYGPNCPKQMASVCFSPVLTFAPFCFLPVTRHNVYNTPMRPEAYHDPAHRVALSADSRSSCRLTMGRHRAFGLGTRKTHRTLLVLRCRPVEPLGSSKPPNKEQAGHTLPVAVFGELHGFGASNPED